MNNQPPTNPQQQQQSQESFKPVSSVIKQVVAKVSLRIDDLVQTITTAFNVIVTEKDNEITTLNAKIAELQAQITTLQVTVKEKQPQ